MLRPVEALPDNTQAAFRLHAIEGYSHAEAAEMLIISEGTSKWYPSTARPAPPTPPGSSPVVAMAFAGQHRRWPLAAPPLGTSAARSTLAAGAHN